MTRWWLGVVALAGGCVPASGVIGTFEVSDPSQLTDPGQQDDCESFVTPGYNACDGHLDFTLSLVDTADEDGDGVWEAGEWLDLTIELYSAAEHMTYPGLLVGQGGPAADGQPGWYWYGVFADTSMEGPVRVQAGDAGEVTVVVTTASLYCGDEDEAWRDCPNPSPLVLTLPVE